jgi:hypothetical protein
MWPGGIGLAVYVVNIAQYQQIVAND